MIQIIAHFYYTCYFLNEVDIEGEIQPGLFLDVHGRSLHARGSGFMFVYVRQVLLKVVGIPVKTMSLTVTSLVSGEFA